MNHSSYFYPPTPKPWLMNLLTPVCENLFLKGLPLLRDIPLLNKLPGVRGLAKVRYIDFPQQDQQRLRMLTGKNKATFFLPNHPEFFTDWMLDKYVLSRVSPNAACWAAGSIVNGMGRYMQRFWLNNNLIAQMPGQSQQGKYYSVKSALSGEGVLLHPEGRVNWFANTISSLFPGAAEMAINAYKKGLFNASGFQSWLAPMVWKLRFNTDVKSKLLDECVYIEDRLKLETCVIDCPARRTYYIFRQLAIRDYSELVQNHSSNTDMHLLELRNIIIEQSCEQLADILSIDDSNQRAIIRTAQKWLAKNTADNSSFNAVKRALSISKRWMNLDDCAFVQPEISQEEIAEHLKRIRAAFCKGSFKDSLNQLIPQAVGLRTAHIRAVKPLAIHTLILNDKKSDPAQVMTGVRASMQLRLDHLVAELENKTPSQKVTNPFYTNADC